MFDVNYFESFLAKENTRPLLGCMWEPMINPTAEIASGASDDGILHAFDVQPKDILAIAEKVMETLLRLKGDFPVVIHASGGHQWLEAICGCRILASKEQIWASLPQKHTLDDFLNTALDKDWENKLIQSHKMIVDYSSGLCFAAVPVLHGPIDIISAYMGTMELALAIIEEPEKLKLTLRKAGDAFLDISKKLIGFLKPFNGGYCGRMYTYTKKANATLQNDASFLTSPDVFNELLEPIDRKIMKSLPNAVYHMHNSSLHLASIIADYGMPVMQLSVDINGPAIDKQIKTYEKIKQKTPLVLSCWSLKDMELLRKNLTPQGLALTYIPAPDGCRINDSGSFDDFDLWQQAYDNWLTLY